MLDKFNTWYDWGLILTSKDVTPPEPKTNYIELDGMSGSLDLSETLTGEVTYKDRTISARFWTNEGTREERAKLIRDITTALHGRKITVIEPDDLTHYFLGRVRVKSVNNSIVFAEIALEITCEPYRYAVNESTRLVEVSGEAVNAVIYNHGVKSLRPRVKVTGNVDITFNGETISGLSDGNFVISSLKLSPGANVIGVNGNGSITFTYREAEL